MGPTWSPPGADRTQVDPMLAPSILLSGKIPSFIPHPLAKIATILQTIFSDAFRKWQFYILIEISLKFVPKGPIDNIPLLVEVMAWYRSGDKPLSEAMMVSLLTHICVTGPQCINAVQSNPILTFVVLRCKYTQIRPGVSPASPFK